MSRPLFLTGIAAIALASSCDKPRLLDKERATVEAEIQRANEEMRSIDAKLEEVQGNSAPYGMTVKLQHEETVQRNISLESELFYLNKKCTNSESNLSEIHPRLAAYKAKYLH